MVQNSASHNKLGDSCIYSMGTHLEQQLSWYIVSNVCRIMLSAQYDMNYIGVITIIARHTRTPRLAGQLDKPHADESAKAD